MAVRLNSLNEGTPSSLHSNPLTCSGPLPEAVNPIPAEPEGELYISTRCNSPTLHRYPNHPSPSTLSKVVLPWACTIRTVTVHITS